MRPSATQPWPAWATPRAARPQGLGHCRPVASGSASSRRAPDAARSSRSVAGRPRPLAPPWVHWPGGKASRRQLANGRGHGEHRSPGLAQDPAGPREYRSAKVRRGAGRAARPRPGALDRGSLGPLVRDSTWASRGPTPPGGPPGPGGLRPALWRPSPTVPRPIRGALALGPRGRRRTPRWSTGPGRLELTCRPRATLAPWGARAATASTTGGWRVGPVLRGRARAPGARPIGARLIEPSTGWCAPHSGVARRLSPPAQGPQALRPGAPAGGRAAGPSTGPSPPRLWAGGRLAHGRRPWIMADNEGRGAPRRAEKREEPQNDEGPEGPVPRKKPGGDLLSQGDLPPSTIGAGGLNCRVRNGNGCVPAAMATGSSVSLGCSPRTP